MIYLKKNGGQWANLFKAFNWRNQEDSENMTKIPKHDKRTSLNNEVRTSIAPEVKPVNTM